jgi:hypothetical protein
LWRWTDKRPFRRRGGCEGTSVHLGVGVGVKGTCPFRRRGGGTSDHLGVGVEVEGQGRVWCSV